MDQLPRVTELISLPAGEPEHPNTPPMYWLAQDLFAQLIKEEVLDPESGELHGRPLGLMNWHPSDCSLWKSDHLHLLWENHAGHLRLDEIPIRWKDYGSCQSFLRQRKRHLSQLHHLLALLLLPALLDQQIHAHWNTRERHYILDWGIYHLCISPYIYRVYRWVETQRGQAANSPAATQQRINRMIASYWNRVKATVPSATSEASAESPDAIPSPIRIWECLQQEARVFQETLHVRQTTIERLFQLPQIFIRPTASEQINGEPGGAT